MRAAWISIVVNIDLTPGMDETEYREWAKSTIEELERKNFNTVIFQVKPTSDALYPSKLAPWSKYITGGYLTYHIPGLPHVMIDYIIPQIYWSIDLEIASYFVLLDWWHGRL